ncbi:hypothetical protein [Allokutzneria albata]|uniref:Uncharacterized protein n=1 Tax=Allokutzneria albata TaxID=211114 RepID=A0A1H0DT12_ALLAB|nr:hypothetical protein [Allokutzneria albata]SDN73199.1 hypothetical protein SAMN04489726_7975 [Allokutzneria albata]SDN74470.1 hypothetical protein SAMN04489726_8032 [Allokutzneria albata]
MSDAAGIKAGLSAVLSHAHVNNLADGIYDVCLGWGNQPPRVTLDFLEDQDGSRAVEQLERWAWSMTGVDHIVVTRAPRSGSPDYARLKITGEVIAGSAVQVYCTYEGERVEELLAAVEDKKLDLGVFARIIAGKGDPTARPTAEQASVGDEAVWEPGQVVSILGRRYVVDRVVPCPTCDQLRPVTETGWFFSHGSGYDENHRCFDLPTGPADASVGPAASSAVTA